MEKVIGAALRPIKETWKCSREECGFTTNRITLYRQAAHCQPVCPRPLCKSFLVRTDGWTESDRAVFLNVEVRCLEHEKERLLRETVAVRIDGPSLTHVMYVEGCPVCSRERQDYEDGIPPGRRFGKKEVKEK